MSLTWARLTLRLEPLRAARVRWGHRRARRRPPSWPPLDRLAPPAGGVPRRPPTTIVPGCQAKLDAWYSAQYGVDGPELRPARSSCRSRPRSSSACRSSPARSSAGRRGSPGRWRRRGCAGILARMVPILVALAVVTFVGGIAADRYVGGDHPGRRPVERVHGIRLPGRPDRQPGAVHLRGRGRSSARSSARALPAVILDRGHRDHRARRRRAGPPADPRQRGGRGPGRRQRLRRRPAGDLYIDQKFVLPDGSLVGYDYFGGARSVRRVRQPQVPDRVDRRPRRALPVRRDARGPRPGRRHAGRAAPRRVRRRRGGVPASRSQLGRGGARPSAGTLVRRPVAPAQDRQRADEEDHRRRRRTGRGRRSPRRRRRRRPGR